MSGYISCRVNFILLLNKLTEAVRLPSAISGMAQFTKLKIILSLQTYYKTVL